MAIRATRPEILGAVRERLPPGSREIATGNHRLVYSLVVGGDSPRVKRYHLAYAGGSRLARTHDLDQMLAAFESHLHLHVAETAPRRVFLHAGAVGWRGGAILVAGESFSGKTTLVAELLRAGATYYSDEYAVLDSSGRVHPYPTPLSIRGDPAGACRRPAAKFGAETASAPLPVRLALVTRYRSGVRWRRRRLSPGNGALALLAHTVPARRAPARALAVLRSVAGRATVVAGPRGEAAETAAAVLDGCRWGAR